jgi:hypothetical protein
MSTDAPIAERSPANALFADAITADVTVTVTPTGDVSCTPDPVVVSAAQSTISFRMATTGWVFRASNAIVVLNPGSDFPLPSKTSPDGKRAVLQDRDTTAGSYPYTVYVVHPASGREASVDPTIENQPN